MTARRPRSTDAVEDARIAGRASGRSDNRWGRVAPEHRTTNPYAPDSPEAMAWNLAYAAGALRASPLAVVGPVTVTRRDA